MIIATDIPIDAAQSNQRGAFTSIRLALRLSSLYEFYVLMGQPNPATQRSGFEMHQRHHWLASMPPLLPCCAHPCYSIRARTLKLFLVCPTSPYRSARSLPPHSAAHACHSTLLMSITLQNLAGEKGIQESEPCWTSCCSFPLRSRQNTCTRHHRMSLIGIALSWEDICWSRHSGKSPNTSCTPH